MKKIALTTLLLILANVALAFDGGLEVVKKENYYGLAFKAEIMRIEFLEDKSNTIRNDSSLAVTDHKKELNISVEPDFTILKHKSLKVQVSPMIGVSSKFNEQLHQSKVGVKCDAQGNPSFVPDASCFSYHKNRSTSLINGASLKLDIEPDDRLHFYTRVGMFNNDSQVDYKPQMAVGFTIPW